MNIEKESVANFIKTTVQDSAAVEASLNLSAEQQDKIISVSGFVAGAIVNVDSGMVACSGKVFFNVIFTGEEPERIETGVRFEFKKVVEGEVKNAFCTYELSNFTVKNEGGMLFVCCDLSRNITIFTQENTQMVTNVDCLCKKEEIVEPKIISSRATTDVDDKFDLAKIKKVLLSNATACVTKSECINNAVTVTGNAFISFVLLPFSENSDIVKEVRCIPFKFEIDSNGVNSDFLSFATVAVNNLSVKVYTDEDEGKSAVESLLTLDFCTASFAEQKRLVVTDAASYRCELDFFKADYEAPVFLCERSLTERVSGKAAVTVPEYSRFIKAVGERVCVYETKLSEKELTIVGVVEADCVFAGDSGIVSDKSELPFTITIDVQGQTVDNVFVCADNLQGRLRSGKLEQDVNLNISFNEYSTRLQKGFSDITEGNVKAGDLPSVTVYSARAGDEKWDVCKALFSSEEVICEQNPDISFPLKGGEKIIILRGK